MICPLFWFIIISCDIQATITEIQRLASVAPMSLEHETSSAYTHQDYTFQKVFFLLLDVSLSCIP